MIRARTFPSPALIRPLAALFTLLFLSLTFWSVRAVYAEYLADDNSLASTRAAIRLTPSNPDLYVELAHNLLPTAPAAVSAAIARAISLNPLSSPILLEAADLAEQQHDLAAAASHLRHAVALDRSFGPRWLLADFYARRHDSPRFWPAMRDALAGSYDDVTPLFETCWQFTASPATILPLAIPLTSTRGNPVRTQYLVFLLSKHRLDLAAPVAASLLHPLSPNPQNISSLLAYCDRLLWHNQPAPALETWNALAAARAIPFPALHPAQAASLTNSAFEKPFLQQAFDWRLSPAPGIAIQQTEPDDAAPASLRFECSGRQIEHAELASQFLVLTPGRPYRLTVSYRVNSSGAFLTPGGAPASRQKLYGPDTGFHVRLFPAENTKTDVFATVAPLPNRSGPLTQSFPFTTSPAAGTLYRLILTYDRSLGATRFEGAIILNRIQLGFPS